MFVCFLLFFLKVVDHETRTQRLKFDIYNNYPFGHTNKALIC